MTRTSVNFEQIVQKTHQFGNSSIIFNKQLQKYDLQPYKIEQSEPLAMLKLYQNIQNKYQITREISIDQNNWNQNERRLFVWFIVFYNYFLSENNEQVMKQDWENLSRVFFQKKPEFLQFQYLNLLKSQKRVKWTDEQDSLLAQAVNLQKPGKWNEISKRIFYVSDRKVFRSPKHCRQRWLNHLDDSKRHGNWEHNEDLIIFKYVSNNGKKWSKIVPLLNETRTEHMIKNRYNSLINKNKSNKKQKEEDICDRIYKQLLKCNQKSQIVDSKQKAQLSQTQGKSQAAIGQIQQIENISQYQEKISSPIPLYSPSLYNYGCFYDFGTLMMLNQYYQNTYFQEQIGQMNNTPEVLNLSKKSNFSLYSSGN